MRNVALLRWGCLGDNSTFLIQHSPFIPFSPKRMTGSLFGNDDFAPATKTAADSPLAERLRPASLEDIVGLEDLLAEGRFLRNAIETDRIPSIIFSVPPGSVKPTLPRTLANTTRARFRA